MNTVIMAQSKVANDDDKQKEGKEFQNSWDFRIYQIIIILKFFLTTFWKIWEIS